jgi:hypothetical protein
MFPGPGGSFGGSRAGRQQLRDFVTKKPIAQWAGESAESAASDSIQFEGRTLTQPTPCATTRDRHNNHDLHGPE